VPARRSSCRHPFSRSIDPADDVINPKTGKPLEIVDANGKPIHAVVPVEFTYTPDSASKLTER